MKNLVWFSSVTDALYICVDFRISLFVLDYCIENYLKNGFYQYLPFKTKGKSDENEPEKALRHRVPTFLRALPKEHTLLPLKGV